MKPRRTLPQSLSRRVAIMTAGATVALGDGKGAGASLLPTSPVARIAAQWRAVRQAESDSTARWSNIEAWLMDNFRWADLTDEEQQVLPEATELHAIDAQLQRLDTDRHQCQVAIIGLPATSREDLKAKLLIVADLLADHALAHRLLTTAIEELKALA